MVHETSEELGEALHGKFVQLLTDKLRSKDGRLSPADVAEMGEAFRRELKVIETVFLDAIKSYTQGRMEGRKAQNRSRLFHRLLMRKFEDRFADERALKDKPNFLSRRMLPGFFHMLPLMFGKPKLDTYEKQTEKVAERLGGTADGVLDWSTFYQAQEASQIALHAEIEIAKQFRDAEKRLSWMIAVVNSGMIPTRETAAGSPWVFNEGAAEEMLKELFSDVGPALKDEPTRKAFARQMDTETVETLDKVVRQFG